MNKFTHLILLFFLFTNCLTDIKSFFNNSKLLYASLLYFPAKISDVLPVVTILNLKENTTVQTGFMIGESTEGTTKVEVSLDDSDYLLAVGTKTWSYKLPTGSKTWKNYSKHKIKVRAWKDNLVSEIKMIKVRKGENLDINGDGYGDLIMGAPGMNGSNGIAYIFYSTGKSGITSNALSSANITVNGQTLGKLGYSISTGDINGDGYADLAIGAFDNNAGFPSQGTVYLYISNGANGISTSPNLVINGINSNINNRLGSSLAMGDINGDGYDDLVVGAVGGLGSTRGAVYIFYSSGSNGININSASLANRTIDGETINNAFGISIAIGDINGDGFGDLLVGASAYNGLDGRAYTFHSSGSSGISITSAGSASRIITNSSTNSTFGNSVWLGDINGDGFSDALIGSPFRLKAYTFHSSGSNGITIANSSLATKTYTGLLSIDFGQSVKLSDLDNDGLDDIIIGANRLNTNQGASYIFYTNSSNQTGAVTQATANAIVTGLALEYVGASISVNDLNGDGKLDLVIGGTGDSGTCNDLSNTGIFYATTSNFSSLPISSASVFFRSADPNHCLGFAVR